MQEKNWNPGMSRFRVREMRNTIARGPTPEEVVRINAIDRRQAEREQRAEAIVTGEYVPAREVN